MKLLLEKLYYLWFSLKKTIKDAILEIKLNNLVRTYDNLKAVDDISLLIPSNKIFGIIGKSGAGKSTLVRLIGLLETPDNGEVYYGEERVDNLSEKELIEKRRTIGTIFQNFNLFSSRTAGKNIAYPMEICGYEKAEIDSRVEELLQLVDLADRKDAPISTLSGGQKQRIAIARALACKPSVLFCDEATSALDPQTTRSILNLLKEIQKKMKLTVVMITHQMEVVRDSCDYVAVIDEGKIVETGTVAKIFTNPQTKVTKKFLANLIPEDNLVRWSKEGGHYTLYFRGKKTDTPVMSRISHDLGVEFNIRAGGVHLVHGEEIGTIICDIEGTKDKVSQAIERLKKEGIKVKEEKE